MIIMYPELVAALIRKGISRKDASVFLGISYPCLNKRIRGETDFSVEESKKISSLLGIPVEILFKKTEESQDKIA